MLVQSTPENETRLIKNTSPSTDSKMKSEKIRSNRADFIKETITKLKTSRTKKDIISKIIIEIKELDTNLNKSKVKVVNNKKKDKINISIAE